MTPNGGLTDEEFQAAAGYLDALVQEFEALPFPEIREKVFELLQAVDAIHREGLRRLVGHLHKHGVADPLDLAAQDSVIRTLLLLYDLIPNSDMTQAETSAQPAGFIRLDQIGVAPPSSLRRPVLQVVARLDDIPPGTMRHFDVEGTPALVANVAGEIYAVRDQCPGSMAPLYLGMFAPPVIVCPWHNEAFDVRTGKRADGQEGARLAVLPVAVTDGLIRVAVNTLPSDGPGR